MSAVEDHLAERSRPTPAVRRRLAPRRAEARPRRPARRRPPRATARRRGRTPSVAAAFSAASRARNTVPTIVSRLPITARTRERRRRARQRADEDDPALQRRRRDVGLDVPTADEVEHDVGAAVSGHDDRGRERVDVERAVGVRGRDDAHGRARARRTARASSAVRAVPTTRAPSACASCSPAVPTPLPTACTSTHSPGCRCARVTSASCAVTNASGTPPIVTRSRPSGTGAQCAAGTRTYSAWRAAAGDAEHAGADADAGRGTGGGDHARELEAGDVGREPGGAG